MTRRVSVRNRSCVVRAAVIVFLGWMIAGCGSTARDVARQTEILVVDTLKRVSDLKKAQADFEGRIQGALHPDGDLGSAFATKRLLDANRHQALAVAGAIANAPSATLLARLHSELVGSVVVSGDRDSALLLASFQQPAEARQRWADLEVAEQQLATLRKKLRELSAPETAGESVNQIRAFLKQLEAKKEGSNGKAAPQK